MRRVLVGFSCVFFLSCGNSTAPLVSLDGTWAEVSIATGVGSRMNLVQVGRTVSGTGSSWSEWSPPTTFTVMGTYDPPLAELDFSSNGTTTHFSGHVSGGELSGTLSWDKKHSRTYRKQ